MPQSFPPTGTFGPPVLLGLVLHQVYRKISPDILLLRHAIPAALAPLLCTLFRAYVSGQWKGLLNDYLVCYTCWMTSVFVYRLSPWHPLSGIPGPRTFHVSKLINAWVYSGGTRHQMFLDFHRKYGPIVRVGPNEVSVAEVSAVKSVLGADGLPKGNYYKARRDPSKPYSSLITLTGDEHSQRRRLWDHGMGSEALIDYTEILAKRGLQLISELENGNSIVDISAWISYFSYDFMGDMAFGGGFEMMRDRGDKHGHWKILEDFLYLIDMVSHVPYLIMFCSKAPIISTPLARLRHFAARTALSRIQSGAKIKDLWYYLTDEASLETKKPSLEEVVAEGGLAIIAGADTVATAITSLIYLLLTHPDAMKRVKEEVDQVYPPGSNALDTRAHTRLVFLNACFREAMRLYPPVPTNGSRRVTKGSGGKVIAGRMIPEQTEVFVPPYCFHRNAEYFSNPNDFIPGRWLGEGTDTLTPEAFIPFSRGPANCAGRNLARIEMLMIGSLLFQTFDFEIAEQQDFEKKAWDDGLLDYFVFTRGKLRVKLTKRS